MFFAPSICFSAPMVFMSVFCVISSMIIWSSFTGRISVAGIDPLSELDCTRKLYTFQVSNTDVNGRVCSDEIQVMSCWGRCDSNEVLKCKFTRTYMIFMTCDAVFTLLLCGVRSRGPQAFETPIDETLKNTLYIDTL